MNVDAYFVPAGVEPADVAERTAVVIDVIRATSTIVTALAHGARAVYPTVSTEDALKLASSLGRDDTLLCGERKGLKVDGFDLGNSPAEYTEETVGDKRLVMSTTNGTRAFAAAAGAERVVAASFLNLGAVADALEGAEELVVICAGKEDRFSLDDAVCAGHLLRELEERGGEPLGTDDAATAALRLAAELTPDEAFLRSTRAGLALVEIGLESDLALCARRDVFAHAPEMEDRVIRLSSGGSESE
ncbi:MAG: 2-phosphosulfolactate phosphatase family protein [Gemmatimonadetes bacterium]|nr:2-phosphosulfolactate phosphatase [Gemmatimonadota bacterium]NIR78278.1 2-phosphosulfolactate phosphatase [Gemmatimonadota bacterium]NIT86862.1 2-phosphosulfolactate phosphatase [Gemmatimonadota bacterium]NIU30730.1 2-phosphosulfolactate phosphatase [Gemmatimonadota bacterium]NIU35525.1 2-phosphosulfolactate phosphatase family protein [Gemmatimonadota bacterium]